MRARSHSIMCKDIPPYQASAVFEIIDGRTAHTDHGHGFLVSFSSPLFLMVTRKSTLLSIKNVVERRRQLTCILAMWWRIVPWTPLPVAKLILPIFSRTGRCDERSEMKFYLLLCIPFSKTNHDLPRQLVRDKKSVSLMVFAAASHGNMFRYLHDCYRIPTLVLPMVRDSCHEIWMGIIMSTSKRIWNLGLVSCVLCGLCGLCRGSGCVWTTTPHITRHRRWNMEHGRWIQDATSTR